MGSWCITVCGCGGRGQERGIYVYLWLSHIAVQQKQTQHCKTTIVVGYVRTQSCLNICNPMDCSLPGASVHGIFQARILEWVAISYPRGSSWSRDWTQVSYISCIARQILYHCTTWKILKKKKKKKKSVFFCLNIYKVWMFSDFPILPPTSAINSLSDPRCLSSHYS